MKSLIFRGMTAEKSIGTEWHRNWDIVRREHFDRQSRNHMDYSESLRRDDTERRFLWTWKADGGNQWKLNGNSW